MPRIQTSFIDKHRLCERYKMWMTGDGAIQQQIIPEPTMRLSSARAFLFSALTWIFAAVTTVFPVNQGVANPEGGDVVAGDVRISAGGNRLDVVQGSNKAIIDWQGFSIGSGEQTHFSQPSTSAITLNRVQGSSLSQIDGGLSANGQVFLVNPNGVIFGEGSQVSLGGLVATTSDIPNADFLSGNYTFSEPSINPGASIINLGQITVDEGGSVVLAAPKIANEGLIQAKLGRVELAGTNTFTLDFDGDGLLSFEVGEPIAKLPGASDRALVSNAGIISADGGVVTLTVRTEDALIDRVINMDGIIQARAVDVRGGTIILSGGEQGIVEVSGTLDVSGKGVSQTGGSVKVLGEKVGLFDGTRIEADGYAGGGEVLVGGNFQGKGTEPNAQRTYVANNAEINASAMEAGNGGRVIVWADEATQYYGDISARGGVKSGGGGFVEISGKGKLAFDGFATVSAMAGNVGMILLDPNNIVIEEPSPSVVTNVAIQQSTNDAEVLDSFIAFADRDEENLVITDIALESLIGSITLQAQQDITVNAQLDLVNQGSGESLVMQAGNDINVNASIITSGANVVLEANSPQAPIVDDTGNLTISTSVTVTVTDSSNSPNFTNSEIITNGGNVDLTGAIVSIGSPISADTGNISITADNLALNNNAIDSISSNGVLTVQPMTIIRGIDLATPSPGTDTLGLNQADLNVFADGFSLMTFGREDGNHNIEVGNVSFRDPVEIRTPNGGSINASGQILALEDPITFETTGNLSAGNTSNDFSTVNINNAKDVSLFDVNSIDLGTSNVNGQLIVTADGGITNSGPLSVAGEGVFTAAGVGEFPTGAPIILTNPDNDFQGSVSLNNSGNNDVSVTDSNALVLGTSIVGSGELTVNANGITQNGSITQAANAGTATFSSNGGPITLTNPSNDFTNAVSLFSTGSNNIEIVDSNTLALGSSSLGSGPFSATARDLVITSQIEGEGDIRLQPLALDQSVGIGDGAGNFSLSSSDIANLSNGFSSITIGSPGLFGGVTIENATFNDPLIIQANGPGANIRINDTLSGNDNASITINGSGQTTTLNGNIFTSGNAVVINDAVQLVNDSIIDTTAGGTQPGSDITFNGSLDGPSNALTIRAGFWRNSANAPFNVASLFVDPDGDGATVFGSINGVEDRQTATLVSGVQGNLNFTINGCVMGISCEANERPTLPELVPADLSLPELPPADFSPQELSPNGEIPLLTLEKALPTVWELQKVSLDPRDSRYSNLGNEELWREKSTQKNEPKKTDSD